MHSEVGKKDSGGMVAKCWKDNVQQQRKFYRGSMLASLNDNCM